MSSRDDDEYESAEEYLGEVELEGLIENLKSDRGSYCEKMGQIALLLRSIVLAQEYIQAYKTFKDLDQGFFEAYSVWGSDVADLMGYSSFEKMCRYAPEIVGEISIEPENGGHYVFTARNITAQDEELKREQEVGLTEQQYTHGTEGRMKKYIDDMICNKVPWPSEAELKGRMKICLALEDAGGSREYVHLNPLQVAYERRHGEKLSTETHRKYFTSRESNFNISELVKDRMNFEISIRAARNSTGMKNNLEFKLRHNRIGCYPIENSMISDPSFTVSPMDHKPILKTLLPTSIIQ